MTILSLKPSADLEMIGFPKILVLDGPRQREYSSTELVHLI